MRFRKEPVAVVADIKAMFHQCRVPQNDQRFLRFLWWPKGDTKTPPKVHAMAVHLFGATSSPSVVCYSLRNIADTNGHEFSELAVTALRRSFYMDDMLQSVRTAEEAKALIPEMKELLKRGGFELGKFASTDRHVIESVSACDRAKSLKEFDFDDGTPLRILHLGCSGTLRVIFSHTLFLLKTNRIQDVVYCRQPQVCLIRSAWSHLFFWYRNSFNKNYAEVSSLGMSQYLLSWLKTSEHGDRTRRSCPS